MVGSVLSGSACPSPRPRASPDALPASNARPARTPLPSAWGRPGAGRPLGSALCCCQRWAGSAPLTTRPGGPGAPPSFLLQPRSPSASWPCSLRAGTSPEARSPPSGCRPRPLRIPPRLIAGPRGAGRHRAPNTRAGASLQGRPIHGGWQGRLAGAPSHVAGVPLHGEALRAPPMALVQKSRWHLGPGWAVSAPRGPRGSGRAWRRAPYVIVLPSGPRIHGTSP